MILVSAIYNNNPNSILGGRGRNINFYLSSLRNIANLNLPFVLYCDPSNVELYKNLLQPYFSNLYVFGFELKDFIYYKEFIEWKETFWQQIHLNDRNEVLCYSKLYFLQDIIKRNIFNKQERYFWIDSGLTHHGIIPEKIGGVELLVNYSNDKYYPANLNNIFNPTLAHKLDIYIPQDKLFFCGLTTLHSVNEKLFELTSSLLNTEIKTSPYHIIGGFFGGSVELLNNFFNIYNILLKNIIDNKVHMLEEPILSALYPYFKENILLEQFSSWWFYSPGEPNSFLTEEGDSFYKIFTKIYEK